MNDGTRKHDRILEIYSRLLSGELIRKAELAEEYGVNPRSIQRDIDSIRDFYANRATQTGEAAEIRYDHAQKGFRLVSSKTVALTNAELFAISKILMESRSLCKEEMEHIVEELIEACLPANERKKMADLIRNELFHYVEPRHQKMLINRIWELGTAVYQHHFVHLEYQKTNGEVTHADIKPVGIICSEYYFYLIAYIGEHDKKYPGYPTIYRVDRIAAYKISKETFHVPYKDRFEEGEFRKRVQFMFPGKLTRIKLKYTGRNVEAVLDRLPTAKILSETEDSYTIEADVYGKGILMWLLSQGRNIEVLKPQSMRKEMKKNLQDMLQLYK